jgi:alkylation response protein AidB-like acyl-CoA dehydrogenase
MGVVGLTVPEEHGGMGLGLVDLVLLLEEAGRAGLPEPVLETTALAVPVIVDAPGPHGEALRARWLGAVAAGEAVMAVGSSSATVAGAAGADLLLIERGGELHAVPAAEVTCTPRPALAGTRRLAEVAWEPSPATVVVSGHEAVGVLAGIGDRAAMGTGAVLVGVADRLIAMAAQYAVERSQFGRPIGSFQAVKHHLANALVRVEFARPVVYRAAWSLSVGDPDASLHASMAKAMASEAATVAARTALQVHGAIGYTWEHDLHLWMKPAWALAAAWGDAAEHRARVLHDLVGRQARS